MATAGGPEWPVVRLAGDIDADSVPRARLLVVAAVRPWDEGIVFDLTKVEFFGASGLHLVDWMLGEGLKVRIVGANSIVRRVFEIVELDRDERVILE